MAKKRTLETMPNWRLGLNPALLASNAAAALPAPAKPAKAARQMNYSGIYACLVYIVMAGLVGLTMALSKNNTLPVLDVLVRVGLVIGFVPGIPLLILYRMEKPRAKTS